MQGITVHLTSDQMIIAIPVLMQYAAKPVCSGSCSACESVQHTAKSAKPLRRKHVQQMESQGLQNPHARLFSNPAGDYGSMVNERVGTSDWESASELGDTWASRNAFSYGRSDLYAFRWFTLAGH